MINIRMATLEDVPAIAEVGLESWRAAYRGIMPDEHLDTMTLEERQRRIEKAFARGNTVKFIIAQQGGRMVGMSCVVLDSAKEADCGEMETLYILPEWHRRGIGAKLFEAAVKYINANGKNKMIISVLEANTNACKFYERMGGVYLRTFDWDFGKFRLPVVMYFWEGLNVNEVSLVSPAKEHEQAYCELLAEWKAADEKFVPGTAIELVEENYSSLLKTLESFKNKKTCPSDYVTSDMYFLIDELGKIVGVASLRHYLNELLSIRGGHVGYWIHPLERRKGNAKKILKLTLEKCREYAIERVLITCSKSNVASAKTIIANGGVLENEAVDEKGDIFQRYWIVLGSKIKFEFAQKEDAPTLTDIQKLTFEADSLAHTGTIDGPTGYDSVEWQLNRMTEFYYYKIICDGNIVGGMIIVDKGESVFELRRIFIAPDFQNLKIGQQAMEFMHSTFNTAVKWQIDTPEWATRNHHLYEKMGYKKIGACDSNKGFLLYEYERIAE